MRPAAAANAINAQARRAWLATADRGRLTRTEPTVVSVLRSVIGDTTTMWSGSDAPIFSGPDPKRRVPVWSYTEKSFGASGSRAAMAISSTCNGSASSAIACAAERCNSTVARLS